MGHESGIPKIVVGVDGSDGALEALRCARYLAGALDARIEAIGCWDYPRTNDGYVMVGMAELEESVEKTINEAVTQVFGSDAPANLQINLVQGDPRPALTLASKNADLLIVGRRGRSRLAGLLIGSVSSFCIANAKCPVLVAHASDDARNE